MNGSRKAATVISPLLDGWPVKTLRDREYARKLAEPNSSNTCSPKSPKTRPQKAAVWGLLWGCYFTIESKSPISVDSSERPPDRFLIGTTRDSRHTTVKDAQTRVLSVARHRARASRADRRSGTPLRSPCCASQKPAT